MNNNVFTYKNFLGSIETSVEDLCLHGKLLFINDLVTYEAQTPAKLKKEFEAAVDNYIEFCQQQNRIPQKPFKGSFNVRLGSELHKKIALRAKLMDIKLNEYVKRLLAADVEADSTVIYPHESGVKSNQDSTQNLTKH